MPFKHLVIYLTLSCIGLTSLFAGEPQLTAMFSAARKCIDNNDYKQAILQYKGCLTAASRAKDTLMMGNANIGLGISYDITGDYQNSLNHYFAALKLYESIDNKKKIAGSLKNIGNIYRMLKSYHQSQDFLEQALRQYTEVADSMSIGNVMNDLGIMNMDQQKFAEAKTYFETILTVYIPYLKEEVKAFAYNNLASVYNNLGKYEDASRYYQSSLTVMKKINNRYGLALVYLNLAELYLLTGDLSKAIEFGTNSIAISKEKQFNGLLAVAFKTMAETHIKLKDYKQATFFLSGQIQYKDTLFKEESAKGYAEMETKYQNERKKKEILELEQQNMIKTSKIENQRLERNMLLSGLAFILLLSAILYRNYYVKQQVNKKLHLLNTKLNEANNSKIKLLGILNHDLRSPVSSLFSFLQYQKQSPNRLTKEEQEDHNENISMAAENLLEAMEDLLIWSKSQMENFIPVLEEIDVDEFLDEIIKINATAARNKHLTLIKSVSPNVWLFTDTNFLKIIFRNLTSNAIKFTPPNGTIRLTATNEGSDVILAVKDNGAGLDPDDIKTIFEWNSIRSDSSGLGLKLVKEFAEKLQASVTVSSEVDKGTAFILSFPRAYNGGVSL